MLQESRAYIITNMNGIKKELATKKPTLERREKIAKSISNLNSEKLKKLMECGNVENQF